MTVIITNKDIETTIAIIVVLLISVFVFIFPLFSIGWLPAANEAGLLLTVWKPTNDGDLERLGILVGIFEILGLLVGTKVGFVLGDRVDGFTEGIIVGLIVGGIGAKLGFLVGTSVEGRIVDFVGWLVGFIEGE